MRKMYTYEVEHLKGMYPTVKSKNQFRTKKMMRAYAIFYIKNCL